MCIFNFFYRNNIQKPHCKVTEPKSKFYLFLRGSEQPGPRATLLALPKSVSNFSDKRRIYLTSN